MAKYKIGVTEAGDAGIDLSWKNKIDKVDGAVLITKRITPEFIKAVLLNSCKVVIHATVTGYGGTVLEPNVPPVQTEYEAVCALVNAGFPKEKIVIRIDPIIPTQNGIRRASAVFKGFIKSGFYRYRISIIDMYPHVRERFTQAGLPLPYGENCFCPSISQIEAVDDMLKDVTAYAKSNGNDIRIECCAEPDLKNAVQCGCVSKYDLDMLGLSSDEDDSSGYQRKNCLCYSGKMELLKNKSRCEHKCLYCYWK